MTEPTHNVLWTSGWDSTFRVLDLLLTQKKKVQPYYVSDHRRVSTAREIRTMDRIRKALAKHDKAAFGRLSPPIIIPRSEILPDAHITRIYQDLRERGHFGGQYDWLTRMAHQAGIRDLELCVHSLDKFADFAKSPVFSVFAFPTLGLTKLDMQQRAREAGFLPLMEMTWFCHWPMRGKPCSYCNPCKYTREEGLGYRVPEQTRLRRLEYRVRRIIRHCKESLRHHLRKFGYRSPG